MKLTDGTETSISDFGTFPIASASPTTEIVYISPDRVQSSTNRQMQNPTLWSTLILILVVSVLWLVFRIIFDKIDEVKGGENK